LSTDVFKQNGYRAAQDGILTSWMNDDSSGGAGSLTKMLQVEVFHTNFNIIDRNANTFADTWGGKCTCPDGSELFVGAKLHTDCEQLSCHGGTSSDCSKINDLSWSHKAGYCSTDAATRTLETTQVFGALDDLTPTHTLEGGNIEINDAILGFPTNEVWTKIDGSASAKYTKISSLSPSTTTEDCQLECNKRKGCIGIQRDYNIGCACCLFTGRKFHF
jgi:hypothetical protein